MRRSRWITPMAGIALAVAAASGAVAFAQTKTTPPEAGSPMVKPPEAASGSGGSSNPDNMPIKRPRKPTNDRMMHEPPASGANAK
ncbi:MAG TPA: hypothetical protein VGM85_05080 [Paraburkholderia sp.]